MKSIKASKVTFWTNSAFPLNIIIEITKYSSLNKLITSSILRFIKSLKSSVKKEGLRKEDILQFNEYNESLKWRIKCEQVILKRQDNYSKLDASLKLFTDEQGIIRVKGRFANNSICYDERHPILLQSGSITYFTTLIFIRKCYIVV